jgi:hypothetical protein
MFSMGVVEKDIPFVTHRKSMALANAPKKLPKKIRIIRRTWRTFADEEHPIHHVRGSLGESLAFSRVP